MCDQFNDEFFAIGTAECWSCDEQEQKNSIIQLELMESIPQPYKDDFIDNLCMNCGLSLN